MSGFSRNPVSSGQKFGMLTAVEACGRSNDGHKLWRCQCECGGTAIKSTNNLRSRKVANCGCYGAKVQVESHQTHGMKSSPEYSSWSAAKNRCHTESSKDFHRYGAIGIVMCDRWRDSFENFLSDMGARPAGTSIDRYPDQGGNYEPGNCRWATTKDQVRNRAKSTWVLRNGVSTHLADVAKELGITFGAAYQRMKRGKLNA